MKELLLKMIKCVNIKRTFSGLILVKPARQLSDFDCYAARRVRKYNGARNYNGAHIMFQHSNEEVIQSQIGIS